MNNNDFDIAIIGSGYRAMLTAYIALKKNKKIIIISKGKNFHGIMSPIKWRGGNFDKGYHFFDGIDKLQKIFLQEFVGKDILHDFGFGGATLTNNKLYPYHALPYWPHNGILFCFKAFLGYILKYRKNIDLEINKAESYQDLLNLLPKEIKEILQKECERRVGLSPSELSFSTQNSPRFLFRQTLFPSYISTFLKKHFQYFEHTLASTRNSLGLDCISLYPKGKNMGVAAEKMQEKIVKNGIKIISSDELKIFNEINGGVKIKSQGDVITAKAYIVTDIDDALNFFEKKISTTPSIYYLPQIFYYFTVNKLNSKFQYVMGNNTGGIINRANNMSLYGEKTSNNECVISAEIADNKDELLWKEPEKYINKVWHEIKLMGLADNNQKFINFEIFPIKKTTPLQLISFNKNLDELNNYIKKIFLIKLVFQDLENQIVGHIFLKKWKKKFYKNE